MRIRRVEVANFRALRNSSLDLSATTALIGENNSGKSAFLAALDLFFSNAPRVKDKDFSDDNFQDPIDITVHFTDLTPHDFKRFESNLVSEALVVTRRLLRGNPKESGNFFVSARVNMLTKFHDAGHKFPKLDEIIGAIDKMLAA
jgi:putative ATP-dependent endonuclease of the OLD family